MTTGPSRARPSAALLACLVGVLASSALAQEPETEPVDVDALWETYDRQATDFEAKQAGCDSGNIAVTSVNRICREAAELSLALADTTEQLLANDDQLSDEDRELLVDGMLTNRQIAGALWVELGECEAGKTILQQLLAHPDVPARPVVEQAATNWLERADACIAATTPVTQVAPPPAVPPVVEERQPSRVGPIVVLASGAAILAGGVAWDLALGGTRSDFETLHERCQTGCSSTEFEDLQDAADTIDGAKVPIAVLYGVGGAAAIGGAVWLAVSGRSGGQDTDVSIAPMLGRGAAGVSLSTRF